MIKKSMLAACLAALAFAALPALASAMYPNPYLAEGGKAIEKEAPFTVSGGAGELNTEGGNFVECESVTGEGRFTTPETGKVKLTLHGCRTIFGITCTTPGDPSGTITTTELPFHLKTVDHQGEGEPRPGILVTPGSGEAAHGGPHFWSVECSFAGVLEVGGTGLVGTITSPAERTPSNTETLRFSETAPGSGIQTHRVVTNDAAVTEEYDLKASFNESPTETTAIEAETTLTFANGTRPEIRTTGE
jgi:hypothetical protein